MGDLFSKPKVVTKSGLSSQQESLLSPIAQLLGSRLNDAGVGDLMRNIVSGGDNPFLRDYADRIFQDGIAGPAQRQFERFTRPAIESSFAGIGGSLSSRKSKAIADAATDVTIQSQASLAQLLPSLIQTQLSGLQASEAARYLPVQQAMQFALQPTRQVANQPGGPGWGLLGDVLGAGATLGGLAYFGGK